MHEGDRDYNGNSLRSTGNNDKLYVAVTKLTIGEYRVTNQRAYTLVRSLLLNFIIIAIGDTISQLIAVQVLKTILTYLYTTNLKN